MSAPAILNVIELAKKFYPQGVAVPTDYSWDRTCAWVFDALEVPAVAFGWRRTKNELRLAVPSCHGMHDLLNTQID